MKYVINIGCAVSVSVVAFVAILLATTAMAHFISEFTLWKPQPVWAIMLIFVYFTAFTGLIYLVLFP